MITVIKTRIGNVFMTSFLLLAQDDFFLVGAFHFICKTECL